jgi:uncharacterized protein (DUF4415 family)
MNEPNEEGSSRPDRGDGDTWVDQQIDASELPPAETMEVERIPAHMVRRSVEVTVRLDPDVFAWFKAQGDDYEKWINAALRIYVEAHNKYFP